MVLIIYMSKHIDMPTTIERYIVSKGLMTKLYQIRETFDDEDLSKITNEIKIQHHGIEEVTDPDNNFDYTVDHLNHAKLAVIMTLMYEKNYSISSMNPKTAIDYAIYANIWKESYSANMISDFFTWLDS